MTARDIVMLSTADWSNPFWTNKQHVAKELARLGHRVLYIDSLGLRAPTATARDLRRVVRRLGSAIAKPRRHLERLWVWSPIVLPWHSHAWSMPVNRAMFHSGLRASMRRLKFHDPWLWTYNPATCNVVDIAQFRFTIYHCVDEIKAQPRMPAAMIERCEAELTRRADIVFATSQRLAEDRRRLNANTHYFANVADYAHFATARAVQTSVPADLLAIAPPRIGFVGALSDYKIDFELLRAIAKARADWSIVLIGQVGEGEPSTDASALRGLANVHLLGPRPYSELPRYLKGMQVAILPNRINDYTAAMFPMKFFEYLAAGLPVVGVDLPALREFSDAASLVGSDDQFIAALERVLAGDEPSLERRLSLAAEHTYEVRTARMLELAEAAFDQ